MFGFTKKLITTIATMLAIFTLAAAPAGAIGNDLEAGGNGPDVEPIDVNVGIGILVTPKASVEVSCTDETATAHIENPTGNFHPFAVRVDGNLVDSGTTVPIGLSPVSFPLTENETVAVEVEVGGNVLIDQDFTRDCLLPDPSYDLLENCDSGQAHVRLVNNGDDVANMGVAYDGVPYVLQSVAPHSSIDWLLAVDPGESADFTVKFGHDVDLGSESFTFACPEEPAPVTPPETPNPGVEVEPPAPVTPPETPNPGVETETPNPVTPTEPSEGPDASSSQELAEAIVEVSSEDAETVAAATGEGDDEDSEALAFGSDDGSDKDTAGAPFGKIAFTGFSLLLLLALVAALYTSRQEIQTA